MAGRTGQRTLLKVCTKNIRLLLQALGAGHCAAAAASQGRRLVRADDCVCKEHQAKKRQHADLNLRQGLLTSTSSDGG